MVAYLTGLLNVAGFADSDIAATDYVIDSETTQGLIVTYRASASATAKPIIMLGHMDVLDARVEDWGRPPFTLTEERGYFFGSGTRDNKYMASPIWCRPSSG